MVVVREEFRPKFERSGDVLLGNGCPTLRGARKVEVEVVLKSVHRGIVTAQSQVL
jgi:hypothetical protein